MVSTLILRKARAQQRQVARQRVEILLNEALRSAIDDIEIAKRQAKIARRLCLRFNLRLPYSMKQLFCHGCKGLMVPGVNARARLSRRRKAITITCMDCEFVNRKVFGFRSITDNGQT